MTSAVSYTKRGGYAAFGSFMVEESPESLLARPDAEYVAPCRLAEERDIVHLGADSADRPPAFGTVEFKKLFYLDPSWTFVNHGAFGGAARVSLRSAHAWAEYAESQPLRFVDRELFPLLVESTRQLSRSLRVPATSLAIISNATFGLNSVIDTVCSTLAVGDVVLCLDVGYGSVHTMLKRACKRARAVLETGSIHFASVTCPADLLAQFSAALPPVDTPLRFVVLDHVTSNTGVVFPISEMAALAKSRGARVLIDGAHGLGSLDLDLGSLSRSGVDYYVTNAHKWLCSGA